MEETEFNNKFEDNDIVVFHVIKGNKNKVLILVSFHFGQPDFYPLLEKIEKFYQESQNIVFEIDID